MSDNATEALDKSRKQAMEAFAKLKQVMESQGINLPDGLLDGAANTTSAPAEAPAPAPAPAQPAAEPGLDVDWSTEGPAVFANGLQVLHRPTDFALLFTDATPFPGRHSPDGMRGNERAAISASLRVPPDAYFRIVSVMANSWNRYVEGLPAGTPQRPRFKLLDAGEMQLDGVGEGE